MRACNRTVRLCILSVFIIPALVLVRTSGSRRGGGVMSPCFPPSSLHAEVTAKGQKLIFRDYCETKLFHVATLLSEFYASWMP